MKKYLAVFAPVLAVAAFGVAPALAQAAPHWYSNGVIIKEGEKVPVTTSSSALTLHALGTEITCEVEDDGYIENPVGGGAGVDSIESFTNHKCVATPPVCPEGTTLEVLVLHKGAPLSATNELPSTLLAGPPIRDEIREVEVAIECSGEPVDVFSGTLTPEVSETESVASFGAGSGELEDAAKNKGTVTGNDSLIGPAGDEKITVKNP